MKIIIIFLALATICTAASVDSSSEKSTTANSVGTTSSSAKDSGSEKSTTANSVETTSSSAKDLEYQQWKNETDKKIAEKYDNRQRNYYNRKNKDLMSSILSVLSRPNLTEAQKTELNAAYRKLSEANRKSLDFKKRAYQSAFNTLVQVLEG